MRELFTPVKGPHKILEIHTACCTCTQYTQKSLNEKQHAWLHGPQVTVSEVVCVIFHSDFAVCIVCWRIKLCEFLGFAWTRYFGEQFHYAITSSVH